MNNDSSSVQQSSGDTKSDAHVTNDSGGGGGGSGSGGSSSSSATTTTSKNSPKRRRRLSLGQAFGTTYSTKLYTLTDLDTRLQRVGVLGKGAFGRVVLMEDKRDNTFVALKIMQKQEIVDMDASAKVQQERRLLRGLRQPFVCELYSTFQDQNCLYMAMEFLRGGELFSLIDRMGGSLSVADTKFYAAPLVSALEYLHRQHVVYRDVKTENVVLDNVGYPLLVDFGFSKRLAGNSGITFTICGTPEFLAPEVIMGSGHGTTSDCWSFGCMMHELFSGASPFSSSDGPMVVIKKILEQEIMLDDSIKVDDDAHQFVKELLDRNQNTRLGCGHQLLMSKHVFFKCEEEDDDEDDEYYDETGEDEENGDEEIRRNEGKDPDRGSGWWARMMRRECPAPWVPQPYNVGSPVGPTEYFDEVDSEEREDVHVKVYKGSSGSSNLFAGF